MWLGPTMEGGVPVKAGARIQKPAVSVFLKPWVVQKKCRPALVRGQGLSL